MIPIKFETLKAPNAQSNFKEGFFLSLDKKKFFFGKLLRPYVGINSDFLKFSLF